MNHEYRTILIVLMLTLAVGLLSFTATAQTGNASIMGHVKRSEGANLPGANVKLYGHARTFSLTSTTDSTGAYRFERLAPGEYLMEAEAQGFASGDAEKVIVERGQGSNG
jgi:hypothetical protein